MGRQALSERRTRRYSRLAGVEFERIIVRGSAGHWALFRTPDDRHGQVHLVPPYEVDWDDIWGHWSSCPMYADRHRAGTS
jgi:hypothetical protein